MKAYITRIAMLAAAATQLAVAQNKAPGLPEDNGLLPKTDTVYINVPPESVNNGKLESLGVSIANNGNIIVGWEDDGDGLSDLEAVWTLLDSTGKLIVPDATLKALDPGLVGQTLTTKFRAYFRKDGSPVSGNTAWGPKIKANLFGDGIGMGATAYGLGLEVPELAALQTTPTGDPGDFPGVQLLTNDGSPIGIVSGVSDAYADADGDIRIGDWEYLSNGNIVIIGESRQKQDLVDKYKGATGENHAIYRIVDATGKEIRPVGLVSAEPAKSEIWHGVGVTRNGFAVRFSLNGQGAVRLFNNSGEPITTNLNIATITGKAGAANGNRGDSTGFHGNGTDAYVIINSGTDEQGAKQVWLTVLNSTNGSVRYSRAVADDLTLNGPDRLDAAIDPAGRVIAVFDDTSATGGANRLVLGRMFDETGKPLGGTFLVSEKEVPGAAAADSRDARVAWRGGLAVVVWESKNVPESPDKAVVAVRMFSTFTPGSVESVGLKRIVADTPVIASQVDNSLNNWEPYISVLGNSVFLIESNAFADGSAAEQRFVVAFQPADGRSMKLGEGFYDDSGKPYKGAINASRQDGNPGRVAGDKRPGAVNFIVGGEASPHLYPEFQSADKRWALGFDRLADGRYGTVQTYKLDLATLNQTPLSKAQDSANGRLTSGAAAGNQITRFGGELAALDNGNFLSVVEDRSRVRNADGNAAVATIFAPDGSVVKESFVVANGDIWSNAAAYKGGFAVRVGGVIYFYDNSGTLKGQVNQSTTGAAFDGGRGDGTRISSHINSPYVFLSGGIGTTAVKVAVFDSRDQKFVTIADVSEPAFAGTFNRVNLSVDALNRFVVAWAAQPPGYEKEQVAARVFAYDEAKKAIVPITKSFFAFASNGKTGIRSLQMSTAITTKAICIAAKGEINLQGKPELGVNSPTQLNFYTVISHPDPKDDPTTPAGGAAPVTPTQLYAAPAGGWKYTLDGSKAVGGAANSGFASLDGSWSHDNGSDEWDGSPIGGTLGAANRPGGVSSIDGYLRLQDAGDPRDFTFADPGSTRKVYLGHDITKEGATGTVLDAGVTLHFRARVPTDGVLDQLHPDGNPGNAGLLAYPKTGDGYLIHDGGKGNFGIKQAAGGIISFSLATAADTGSSAGLVMNNLNGTANSGAVDSGEAGTANVLPLDTTQWHEFWIAIGKDSSGKGTHKVDVYLDGSSTPTSFFVTAGDGSDFADISYIAIGQGSTGQSGALDVDFFDYALGNVAPAGGGTGGGRPTFAKPTRSGTTLALTWTGGGKLQEAVSVAGPWTDVAGNPQGKLDVQTTGSIKFYRVVAP